MEEVVVSKSQADMTFIMEVFRSYIKLYHLLPFSLSAYLRAELEYESSIKTMCF